MRTSYTFVCAMLFAFLLTGFANAQKNLIPDHVNLQYAGSVGWLSAGIDYDILKEKGRLGLRYGYVPERQGGPLHLISTSFFYEPLAFDLSDRLRVNPLDVGMKASYHFGDEFYTALPSRYPEGYYWWKSALRFHLATQTAFTWRLAGHGRIRAVTGYVEFNTNELYLVSYLQNHQSLRLSEVIKTGLGVRISF